MTALLSQISIFYVGAGFDIQMASYVSKYARKSLSDKPFYAYRVPIRISWKVQVVRECSAHGTTAIISEIIFVWFRVTLQIWLESYSPRHASVVLWYHIAYVYILPARIYIVIWFATTPDNKTHALYDCILHTKQRLYCQRCIVL